MTFVFSVSAVASALQGRVHGGTLKMRSSPSTSAAVACSLRNGTTVRVYGSANSVFYSISGKGWEHSNLTGWNEWRNGYGMKNYINLL
jgi:hypothetical protein